MKKLAKLFSVLMVLAMLIGVFAACGSSNETTTTPAQGTTADPTTAASETEQPTTKSKTPVAQTATAEDVYNVWWKLYIQRWNKLVPEVPLYSNQYFDLYNAKFQNFVTSPYWQAADAIVATTVKAGEPNSAILGSATALSGAFRNSSWGKSSPASSDLDVQNLTTGYSTEMTDFNGTYIWNMQALAEEPVSTLNEDGTLTYTIKIKEGLVFSDGSAITAKNYIVALLSNSTAVAAAAGGSGKAGLQVVGFDAFTSGESKEFTGVKLLDDYTFSVTYAADYAGYYYTRAYASYAPNPLALYLGSKGEIVVNPTTKVCGLNDDYYAKDGEGEDAKYVVAGEIVENMKWSSSLPYSGPYVVQNYDDSNKIATLKLNPKYPGDDARGKASIETITYVKVVEETQMDQFQRGEVDIISAITGAAETKAALKIVEENPTKYAETHYDRAGYGKLAFRCDYGPTFFTSVRQAITYTINRPEFAQTFTGGYGSVVHGPYYKGFSAYKAVEDEIQLNEYSYSSDSANKVLEADGWVYNSKGEAYVKKEGEVRYKKLTGYELTDENKAYKTVDGKYQTVKVGDDYYMPLAINYFGTQPNSVTDLLISTWQTNPVATTDIGMYIQYISTEFVPGVYGEYSRMESYGYDGTPKVCAINFATGFNSAMYAYDYYWTINPEYYDDYSNDYLMDPADFWSDYQPGATPVAGNRTDFTSVYDKIGSKVTIDMVEEDENGIAWVTVDGIKYELGMDFLSMAMVYNVTVPEGWTK